MKKLNILLTNDDGYNAPGILLTKKMLKDFGNVYVAAPRDVMSGKGCSGTFDRGLEATEYAPHEFYIDGTPSDCVSLGLTTLFKDVKFDLVVSGCNKGLNISYDTMYSGTIGASLESLKNRIPAVALSAPNESFDGFEKTFKEIFELVITKKLYSKEYIVSINWPLREVKGYKFTRLSYRDDNCWYELVDGRYENKREFSKEGVTEDLDLYAIQNGFVSITPVNKFLFSERIYRKFLRKTQK